MGMGRGTTGGNVTGNGMTSPRPRPIIFSGPMVRAITREIDPKTQTRRVVTGMALTWLDQFLPEFVADPANHLSPYGHAGDRLWVRETFAGDDLCGWVYRAEHPDADIAAGDLDDGEQSLRRWTPSIHMPRIACRLKLDVVAVRIERLQDCSEADAQAEGIDATTAGSYRAGYALLWDSLNEKRGHGWAKNPWVWVIEFRRVNG